MKQSTTSSLLRHVTWVSALAAVGFHAYLLNLHYSVHFNSSVGPAICDLNSTWNCSTTAASVYSELFGVPMALWGLIANASVIFLVGSHHFWGGVENKIRQSLIVLSSVVIALASLTMGALSAIAIGSICPFCVVTYILSAITLWGAWTHYRPLAWELGPPFTQLISLVAAGLAIGFVGDQMFEDSYNKGPQSQEFLTAVVSDWQRAPTIEVADYGPLAMGPSREAARLTIVEFADFRCGHCRTAAGPLKSFARANTDVRFEFYTWPLDGECNTSIGQNNGASCLLARVAWCGEKLGQKGWAIQEQIFSRFENWRTLDNVKSGIKELAESTGLNPTELETCSSSPESREAIVKHAGLGTTLGLRGTPTIFINGRQLMAEPTIPVLNAIKKAAN
ncbi:MAG TPA: vitamin K epoxide reductase family protein [Pseudobdellovibrionaceae bacterium]|nr:vitamin K epoxide reductase family protein [Pseudobdellovibrionaceae bacterium]